MSKELKKDSEIAPSPGKVRPTQLITTHGPGSFVQTENDSVMVMAIDFWAHKSEYIPKHHIYLQKITKKNHFKMPYVKESPYRSIACISFPRWGYCSYTKCQWLQFHKDAPYSERGFFCKDHPKSPLLPARLVTVCKRGHIDDFPWVQWAHSKSSDPRPVCEDPKIRWTGGRQNSSISNFRLECQCGASNSMGKAMSHDGIELYQEENGKGEFKTHPCSGEYPWLEKKETCKKITNNEHDKSSTEIPFGIIVRSTSLYYSKIIRGIIIPQLAHPIIKYLQSEKYETLLESPMFQRATDEEKAEDILESNKNWKEVKKYTVKQIVSFMNKLSDREGESSEISTELDLKKIEYQDLIDNENFEDEQEEKEIEIQNVELSDEEKKYFKTVRRIDILTALEVPRYFTRLKPPGEINVKDKNFKNETICSLEIAGKTKSGRKYEKNNWLPCVIKKGEGIFIVFHEDFIKKCMNEYVENRLGSLIENHKKWEDLTKWPSSMEIDNQYIFLHSLSHLLIKELSLRSGYGEASISERIYSSGNMCGILIYTTSSGDGSLGGLVRQAEGKLLSILQDALAKARVCSRDPICLNENPKKMGEKLPVHLTQNGSACYGCMLLPETSCEYFNKMLDRKILVDKNYGLVKMIEND